MWSRIMSSDRRHGILDEHIPFLRGEPLKAGEDERYGQYETTTETYTLYEHCLRALQHGSTAGAMACR